MRDEGEDLVLYRIPKINSIPTKLKESRHVIWGLQISLFIDLNGYFLNIIQTTLIYKKL